MDEPSFGRVGVVIVTHASARDVGHALSALPTNSLACTVVVDNASPDNTVAVVRSLHLPNVEIVEQANLGFGAGNDAGRSRMPPKADYVLLLNPDCVIEPVDLDRLIGYLDTHPNCALVGPCLRDGAGSPRTPGGALPTPLTELQPLLPRAVGQFFPRRHLPDNATDSGPVGYVEGACMLVRCRALDQVGGFDHRYFLCFEEMDLARRLLDAGWTVDVCGDAHAIHTGKGSRQQVAAFSQYHKHRSQRLYLERWFGARAARRHARLASAAWWLRRRTGRLGESDYNAQRAGIAGEDFKA